VFGAAALASGAVRLVATAKGVLRHAAPSRVRRGLEARAYANAPAIAPPELGGLQMRTPGGYADHYTGIYEPAMTTAIRRLVAEGSSCADIGAHLGYFTLLMATLSGREGHVVSVEASPANAAAVRSSVRLNGLDGRVRVVQAAAGASHGGRVVLMAGPRGGDMEFTTSPERAERARYRPRRGDARVPLASLDSLVGDAPLDVVKIDVEGAEGEVLRGARRVLREQRPAIVLEFHGAPGWLAVPELLDAGYAFETVTGQSLATPTAPADVPYHVVARPAAPG
jgi:FkbM family methyltransferase